MRIGRVVAGLEYDRIVGRETRQRIDVRVGVVALQIAVLEPEHALSAKFVAQHARHLFAALLGMALMQAAPGRQQRTGAIGLDRAAFERPVDAAMLGTDKQFAREQAADQAIVAARVELAAPAGEAEIS